MQHALVNDVNELNADGFYPLHLAAKNGDVDTVKTLLEKGANPSAKVDGLTAEDFAQRSYFYYDGMSKRQQRFLEIITLVRKASPAHLPSCHTIMSQDWFTAPAKKLGFSIHGGGCNGVAYRAMQSYLHDERDETSQLIGLKNYIQRIERIRDIAINTLPARIQSVRNKVKQREPLTQQEQIDITIPAFYENVALFQHGDKFKKAYRKAGLRGPHGQDVRNIIKLFESDTQQQAGGIVNTDELCGVYNESELFDYFSSLRRHLRATRHPIAMVLFTNVHAIMLGFDPVLDCWTLIEAGIVVKTLRGSKAVVSAIVPALVHKKQNEKIIFTTQFFTTHKHSAELTRCLTEWKSTSSWKAMHAITKGKLNARSGNHDDWFSCACRDGHYQQAKDIYRNRGFFKAHKKTLLIGSFYQTTTASITILCGVLAVSLAIMPYIPLIVAAIAVVALALTMLGCYAHDRYRLRQARLNHRASRLSI